MSGEPATEPIARVPSEPEPEVRPVPRSSRRRTIVTFLLIVFPLVAVFWLSLMAMSGSFDASPSADDDSPRAVPTFPSTSRAPVPTIPPLATPPPTSTLDPPTTRRPPTTTSRLPLTAPPPTGRTPTRSPSRTPAPAAPQAPPPVQPAPAPPIGQPSDSCALNGVPADGEPPCPPNSVVQPPQVDPNVSGSVGNSGVGQPSG